MKAYIYTTSFLLLVIFLWGFLLPYLFSAKDDVLPLLGVLVFIVMPPVCYWFGFKIGHTGEIETLIKHVKQLLGENKK